MSKIIYLSEQETVSMSDEWFEFGTPEHFWMEWRFQILKTILKPHLTENTRILEIGCGSGSVMYQLENTYQIPVDGCDLNLYALQKIPQLNGKRYLYNIFDQNTQLTGSYDVVLLLDVIEHIENDNLFVEMATRHLKPGGILIIGVPGHSFLFSRYDLTVGHKRRYSARHLSKVMQKSNLINVDSQYWGLSLLPLALIRKIHLLFVPEHKIVSQGFQPPHPWFNTLFKKIMKWETSLFKKVPTGISVMAIGHKPN